MYLQTVRHVYYSSLNFMIQVFCVVSLIVIAEAGVKVDGNFYWV